MDIKAYFRILKRRKVIVLAITLLSLATYGVRLLVLPPKYQAKSMIILRTPAFENQVLAHSMQFPLTGSQQVDVKTQIQLMSTRTMAQAVAHEAAKGGLRLTPDQVLDMRSIQQVGDTPAIEITVTAQTPQAAQAIADLYARLAVEENHKLARRSFENAIDYLKEKIDYYRKRRKEVEEELSRFLARNGFASYPDELKQQVELMNSLRSQLQQAMLDMEAASRQISQVRARLPTVDPEAVQRRRIPNPKLEEYRGRISPLEGRLLELSRGYTEEHPKVQAVKEQVAKLRSEMLTVARAVEIEEIVANPDHRRLSDELITAEMDRERFQVRMELLEQMLAAQREEVKTLSALDKDYFELEEESETIRKQQQKLGELLEELQVSTLTREGSAEMLERASPPKVIHPFSPLATALILIISLALGVAVGTVVEAFDDRLRTPSHARRHLGLPTLGSIPKVEKNGGLVLAAQAPKSVVADPFHRLGFNVQQAAKKVDAKVIAITSTKPKEGKTTICANLATSLSWGRSHVCLVDADLRHPGCHHLFSLSNTVGLSSLLGGELEAQGRVSAIQEGKVFEPKSFQEAVRQTVVKVSDSLHLLPAGPPGPNPVRLLHSLAVWQLLQVLKEGYDYVFLDTPPVLSVSDAQILASRCDGILLVVDAQTTRRNEVTYVISQLRMSERPIVGVVLNFVYPADETYDYYYHEATALGR